MIKTTRWRPDTCSCIFEYTWDSTVKPELRTHTFRNIINTCQEHSSIQSDADKINIVRTENTRKNRALQLVLENGPSQLYSIRQSDGVRILRDNVDYRWSFSGSASNRTLNISFFISNSKFSLTGNDRNIIDSVLSSELGNNTVVIS